jgi:hypothetical protein
MDGTISIGRESSPVKGRPAEDVPTEQNAFTRPIQRIAVEAA